MYDKLLKDFEGRLELYQGNNKYDKQMSDTLDNIIKIKTIQALDTSAELIAASRRVSRN